MKILSDCRLCQMGILSKVPLCFGCRPWVSCPFPKAWSFDPFLTHTCKEKPMNFIPWIPVVIAVLEAVREKWRD